MSFTVYIIYSSSLNQYYIGHTENLQDRLFRHNNSGSKATTKSNDWLIKYIEEYSLKSNAYKREMEIKSKKSRGYIEWLIENKN